MSCSSCVHFTDRAASDAATEPCKTVLSKVGICRRYPPKMTARGDRFLQSVFPNVHREHSCGEYNSRVPLC